MSCTITPTKITLTKGDTLALPVDFHQPIINADIAIYVHQKDKIAPVIEKHITTHTNALEGKSLLLIEKELTETLLAGTYPLSMAITFQNGVRHSFYPPHPEQKAYLEITNPVSKEI